MAGQTVYEVGTYSEIVELESGPVRLVECGGGGYAPLYRLEYQDARGYGQNEAYYDWPAAVANFERRSTGE